MENLKNTPGGGIGEDIFDIVDFSDNVVGKAARSEVHSKGLLHRAVHVLIFSKEGSYPPFCQSCSSAKLPEKKILLQKRSALKDLNPGMYTTSCSGHVDSGESYDESVLRELREETGISVVLGDLKKIGKIHACSETGNEFTFVYEMEVPVSQKFSFSPMEVDSFEWMEISKFEREISENPEKFTRSFVRVYFFWKKSVGGV